MSAPKLDRVEITPMRMEACSRDPYDVIPPETEDRRAPFREVAELRARVVGLETVNASLRLEVERLRSERDALRECALVCVRPGCVNPVVDAFTRCSACAAEEGE